MYVYIRSLVVYYNIVGWKSQREKWVYCNRRWAADDKSGLWSLRRAVGLYDRRVYCKGEEKIVEGAWDGKNERRVGGKGKSATMLTDCVAARLKWQTSQGGANTNCKLVRQANLLIMLHLIDQVSCEGRKFAQFVVMHADRIVGLSSSNCH